MSLGCCLKFCCKVKDVAQLRKILSPISCIHAVLDMYSDVNTIINLFYFGSNDGLCTYECTSVLAWVLTVIVVTSALFQAKVFLEDDYYGSLPRRCFYAIAALFGFGTIPVLYSIWPEIHDDVQFNRYTKSTDCTLLACF